jgi:hypothetical protein
MRTFDILNVRSCGFPINQISGEEIRKIGFSENQRIYPEAGDWFHGNILRTLQEVPSAWR